eukprot:TRINITY_DN37257_c0_g1_i1.p1 TRINITY_DN37257_c0_g1~~TRINITY_DN37257_c0_g1_i1.p1  ORF type:complete len:333 (+),score=75.08 TRINITY_DN37257_c0_g1_i1:99-1097(+)
MSPVFKTAVTRILGIEHPIICGGMTHVGFAELAVAVSEAGGLGMVTALTMNTPEGLRREINKVRGMTKKPFGVNLTILPALLPADYDGFVKVICEERVPVIEITGGNPGKYVPQLKAAGVKIIHKSATLKHALNAQKAGVDLIEIAGFESSIAGRKSDDDVGTWVLLAKACTTLKTPVVVSGASATGNQLAAALSMGAQGITMGTRFLATQECPIHENVKKYVSDSKNDEYSTTLILKSFGNATRVAKNTAALEVLKLEKKQKGFGDIRKLVAGTNVKDMFHSTGDTEKGAWSCGQSVGLIQDIPTCKDLIEKIVCDAKAQLEQATGLIAKL